MADHFAKVIELCKDSDMLRLVSVPFLLAGTYLVRQSYYAFAGWQETTRIGDFSAAELYELSFWLNAPAGFALMLLGAFLAGRASTRSWRR